MYSGTTIGPRSGNNIGVHQRIDRIARKQLQPLLKERQYFPYAKRILHYEGNNGPDAVKRKSPSIDEPWHYIDPKKMHDVTLVQMIMDHLTNLSVALRDNNHERAAFEAAWMAHAIVDGLTPAHHFPLADKIEELFGMPHHHRQTIRQKNVIKGTSRRDTLSKNWQYWGGGGIFSSHALFEWGVVTSMMGRVYRSHIKKSDITDVAVNGYEAYFLKTLSAIDELDVYDTFRTQGWNWRVARLVNKTLLPMIISAVVLGWYAAVMASEQTA
jgi:hypothetical protein